MTSFRIQRTRINEKTVVFLFIYSVFQKGGEEEVLTEAADVTVLTAPVDVIVVMTAADVVAVVIGTTPPAGVAAPPHTLAGGRAAEVASQALG